MPEVNADDAGVLSRVSEDIDVALQITGLLARFTQQKLNVEKSKAWSIMETALQSASGCVLNGEHLDVVKKFESLGIHLTCAKGILLACLVGPVAMFGFPAGGYTLRLINALRTPVVQAPWGAKRRSRCREILLTLFDKWHPV